MITWDNNIKITCNILNIPIWTKFFKIANNLLNDPTICKQHSINTLIYS